MSADGIAEPEAAMRSVIHGWSGLGFLARIAIAVATGVVWAVSSLHRVLADPDYWDPVTAADFFAVYAYSTAWLLTAVSLLVLREVARPAPALSALVFVVAAACAVTGVANGIEDGLGLRGFGPFYVIAFLTSLLGMFAIARVFLKSAARRLTFVPALGGLAIALATLGGGVLGLVAWLGFGLVLVRERVSPVAASAA